jgi:hypothetical protein
MGTTTTAQAFQKFLEDEVEPTDWQEKTLIPARKNSVDEKLTEKFPASSDMPLWKVRLIGSAAKGTIIRPIDDIDVLAIFSNENGAYEKYRSNAQSFLYRIREAYAGTSMQQVGARGQAVRIFFETGGHVDIAPVFFADGDDYLLPAGDKTWIRTSPFKANSWFSKKNTDLNGNLLQLVRLLKKWNRSHSSRLKSFHLETATAGMFTKLGYNQRANLRDFFSWAPNYLRVSDPGGHNTDLSTYLSEPDRRQVVQSFSAAHDRCKNAIDAEDNGDHAEAKRLWSIVLGDDFPQ